GQGYSAVFPWGNRRRIAAAENRASASLNRNTAMRWGDLGRKWPRPREDRVNSSMDFFEITAEARSKIFLPPREIPYRRLISQKIRAAVRRPCKLGHGQAPSPRLWVSSRERSTRNRDGSRI